MKQDQWELLSKYFANELDTEGEIKFKAWLAEKNAHRELFQKVEKVWNEKQKVNNLSDEDFLKSIGSDPAQNWNLVNEKIQKENQNNSWSTWTYRIAASIALIVGISWMLFQVNTDSDEFASYASLEHFQSSKDTTIVLSDGSKIWLNKNSILKYPDIFEDDKRVVFLEGEGYFEVERDESRPFLIKTDESLVQVLGTTFNVKARTLDSEVIVTVTSGSVSLANKTASDQKVILKKGEVGVFNISNQSLEKQKNQDPNFLAWKTGVFTFNNLPLRDVIKSLADAYQVTINLDDETVLQKTLTATFEKQPINEVLGVICSVHNLDMNTIENRIILSKKK